jgi:hypothetical protein
MTETSSAAAGWYLDGHDPRRRYWDGAQWTAHFEEPAQSPAAAKAESKGRPALKREEPKPLLADQLDAILDAEVANWTAKGWKLEGTAKLFGRGAILREPRWQAFLRNLLLVLVTCGFWLIYLLYKRLIGRTTAKIITVDRFGRVKTFRRKDQTGGE